MKGYHLNDVPDIKIIVLEIGHKVFSLKESFDSNHRPATKRSVIIDYWICIRKYWMTLLEISVQTCELRYQAKESNILYRDSTTLLLYVVC